MERHGEERVYDVGTSRGHAAGIRRLVIDIQPEEGPRQKVRMYLDETSRMCNVVPIAVSPLLDTPPPLLRTRCAREVWTLISRELDRGRDADLSPLRAAARRDARARLRLFVDSLDTGHAFLCGHRDLLRPVPGVPFSLSDAQLTLGPAVWRLAGLDTTKPAIRTTEPASERRAPAPWPPPGAPTTSPFFVAASEAGLVQRVIETTPCKDTLTVFITVFEVLADAVGAHDPRQYMLPWPYSGREILENPYLRLRVGPTAADIIAIIHLALGAGTSAEQIRRDVLRLLDRFIDFGSVVPTTAEYDGHIYRVYRKGERMPRVAPTDRLLNAWRCHGRALSMTRVSKLATFLAFSNPGDSSVVVRTMTRGNALCFAPSVLHEDTEVAHYLRRTNQVKQA